MGILRAANEPLAARFGLGATHRRRPQIERLVAFTVTGDYRIALADRPPVYLALDDPVMRNWEGLARWDDRGFLVITDEWPRTMFGWVALAASP